MVLAEAVIFDCGELPKGVAEGLVNFSMITCILTGQVTSMRS
jgi:hypothetical protein